MKRKTHKKNTSQYIDFLDGAGRGIAKVRLHSLSLKVKDGKVISKKCPKCLTFQPIEEFTLTRTGNYATYCRECFCEIRGRNGSKNKYIKTKRDIQGLLMFLCSECGEFKYLVEYSRDTIHGGRSYKCKDCEKKRHKQYYKRKQNGKAV